MNRPACADRYLHAEDLAEGLVWVRPEQSGRRQELYDLVQRLLPPELDPWLLDAAWRWVLATCRTTAGAGTYLYAWRPWAEPAHRDLDGQWQARPREVTEYIQDAADAGLAQRTVHHRLQVLRSWYGWAEEREHIERGPIRRQHRRMVKIDEKAVVKATGVRQALRPDEAQAVADWCLTQAAPEVGAGVLLQLGAGLRSAEVAGLQRRNLSHKDGVFQLVVKGKGDRTRVLVLEDVVVAALLRYERQARRRGRRGPLLRAPGGGHYTPREIQRWAKAAAAVVGRDQEISSHDLRKTHATLLIDGGAPIEDAQEQLGHANPRQTLACYVVYGRRRDHRTGLRHPTGKALR